MSPLLSRRKSGRRRSRLHPAAIALMTIALISFVTYYAFSQSLPFVHHFTMHAIVDNSVAVRTDSPVRIAGVDVGAVQNVDADGQNTRINFTMSGNGQPIHTDATIRIRSRLFLEGGYYLELNPGTPGAPLAGDGFTIQQRNTVTPVQFYNVLSTFDSAARASLANTLSNLNNGFSFQDSAGHRFSDPGAVGLKATVPQLTPLLKDTALVSRALIGRRPGDLRSFLQSASQVTSTLSGSSSQLVDLTTSLNRTSSALVSADGALARTVSGLDQVLQTSPPALTAIDRSLPPLTRFAQVLDPSLKVAPPIIGTVIKSVNSLRNVVEPPVRGQLLSSLNTTFVALPNLLTRVASLFLSTKSVTDCLRTHVTPTLNTVVPDGAHTSGQPVWKDFIHFLPRIGGSAGNFDGNGHWVRYGVGVGTDTLSLGSAPADILGLTSSILGKAPVVGSPVSNTVGQLVSTALGQPGGGSDQIQGASPNWVGDLPASVFRPDVDCSTQPLPRTFAALGSGTAAASDESISRTPASLPLSMVQIQRAAHSHQPATGARR